MNFDEEYFEYALSRGYDPRIIGTWQTDYVKWLNSVFGFKDLNVLEIGAFCGTIGWCMHALCGANVYFCEPGTYLEKYAGKFNIMRGTPELENLSARLEFSRNYILNRAFHNGIEDLDGMILKSDVIDFAHANMSLEHIKNGTGVMKALANIFRALKPGGILFAILDDDPSEVTHHMPMSEKWWQQRASDTGFDDIKKECLPRLKEGFKGLQHDFFKIYGIKGFDGDGFFGHEHEKGWMVCVWQKPLKI